MDERRKGEIAYAILKHRTVRGGLCVNPEEYRRDLGNTSKALGIDPQELTEFSEALARELVDDAFRKD